MKKNIATQDKLMQAAKKKKRSLRPTASNRSKQLGEAFKKLPNHPKDTHKQKVFNMKLVQGITNVKKDTDLKHGLTLASGKYVTIEEQRKHSDFINKDKRKQVLLKQFLHDSRLLANNHAGKRFYYEIELLKTLAKLAELYKDLTSARFDLCLREEFNVLNLYNHFDKRKAQEFGVAEAELALAEFGMFPHKSDLCLILRSFDKKSKARLDFDDFCSMLIPKDEEFRAMMIERIKVDPAEAKKPYLSTVSEETFNALTKFFTRLTNYCVCAEALKQRLIFDVGLELNCAFTLLAKANPSLLTALDLDRIYKARNIPLAYRDIAEFIKCYDHDCDGKLSFAEFARGFTPLMAVSYK